MMPISSVRFDRKLLFSARQNLAAQRSGCRIPRAEGGGGTENPAVDVWRRPAPDFSPKLYSSLSGPPPEGGGFQRRRRVRPSGDTEKTPGRDASKVPHVRRVVQELLRETHRPTEPRRFITSYKPPDLLQTELMFVKLGKFPPVGPYRNPKPHDFRPQDDDLPNMATGTKKDPGDLEFKLTHRDILRTIRSESELTCRDTMKATMKMNTYKPAEPTWNQSLLLPRLQWPPRSASYTRHRRSRSVYSAFMERVEEKLTRSWTQNA